MPTALTPGLATEQLAVDRPHSMDADAVAVALDTSPAGLTSGAAAARLAAVGPNELPAVAPTPAILRFLRHFDDTLIYVLLVSALIKAIMADWLDFSVILAVTVINAAVGYAQEGRAEKALADIRGMLSNEASVYRDGAWSTIPATGLVPGDVVRLMPGDKVPADLRLLQAHELRIDESALTGESVPASKGTRAVPAASGVGDRASMAFSGTIVAAGQARGIVTGTGPRTEIGAIQGLVGEAGSLATPLTRQLDQFGRLLTLVILGMAAVMLAIGHFLHRWPLADLISAAIGFAVAAIPEGLPALVTITLAIGVQQMARHNAITRKLPSVETLGSVTTVCSDKTGTLTQNEMTVRRIVTADAGYAITGLGYSPRGAIVRDGPTEGTRAEGSDAGERTDADAAGRTEADVSGPTGAAGTERSDADPQLTALLTVGMLCNDAHIATDGDRWHLVGEPTEGALRVAALKAGLTEDGRRLAVLPFDSAHKLMAVLHEAPDGVRTIVVKGAPDRLLERSLTQLGAAGPAPLEASRWHAAIDRLSGQGLRVLAAARRPASPPTTAVTLDDLHDLEFLGLWGIADPPRPEAVAAIADCHTAGVRVKMITGDHKGTAVAISRELDLVGGGGTASVLTGTELEELSQRQLEDVVAGVDVFARTSPEHKIRIVRALQAHGEVVAMTGDGVNDAPAVTRADVGIAMGVKGTEATRDAADIVLADDDFATIRSAIREGRRIYDNLRKSVVFLLPTNGAQSLVILVAVAFGLVLPLTPVQVLWVNMITAVCLSLALAYEPAEPDVMRRPPRTPGGPIITRGELGFVLIVSVLIGGATLLAFGAALTVTADLDHARTVAVLTLVLAQLAYLFNCRFITRSSLTPDVLRGNPAIWWSALALIAVQLVYTYAPFMHELFDSRALAPRSWILPMVLALVVFVAIEAIKAVRHVPH